MSLDYYLNFKPTFKTVECTSELAHVPSGSSGDSRLYWLEKSCVSVDMGVREQPSILSVLLPICYLMISHTPVPTLSLYFIS